MLVGWMIVGARRRGSTRPLQPGEHTIREVSGRVVNGSVWIDWCYRPVDGSATRRHRTKAPTVGQARDRALRKYNQLIAAMSEVGWKPTDRLVDYIDQVCSPAMQAGGLAAHSVSLYRAAMQLLVGRCDRHSHTQSLKNHTIASGARFRVIEACVREIASLHGVQAAYQARTVVSKYVLDRLVRDDLIDSSPIAGKRLDIASAASSTRVRGGVALSVDQWNAVLNHLLNLDPTVGVEPPKSGMYTLQDRIAIRRTVIDLTLVQAVTGMRVGEVSALTWPMVEWATDQVVCHLPDAITKTRRGRDIVITDPGVIARLRERRDQADGSWPVVGSPTKPDRVWDDRRRTAAIAQLYCELADVLNIPELDTQRSHVWRATINTLTMNAGVPDALRAAVLGHTTGVNRARYTDTMDTSAITTALSTLRSAS